MPQEAAESSERSEEFSKEAQTTSPADTARASPVAAEVQPLDDSSASEKAEMTPENETLDISESPEEELEREQTGERVKTGQGDFELSGVALVTGTLC